MKICVQTGDVIDLVGYEKGYKMIKKAGFGAIDWNLDHALPSSKIKKGEIKGCIFEKSLSEVKEHYAAELEEIRKNGLEITQAHAPFPAYARNIPGSLDSMIPLYIRCIEFCGDIGCKNLVIHGISYYLDDTVNTLESINELNRKLYTSLIPALKDCPVTVCMDNIFSGHNGVNYQGNCSDAAKGAAFIDEMNALAGREAFGLCFDTGHANLLHHDMRIIIPAYGSRIKCLHIHDNNGSSDQHRAPLTGTIDWNLFLSALKEIGYKGDLSFETFAQTNAAAKFDEDMILPWLELICKTGKKFREKLRKKR